MAIDVVSVPRSRPRPDVAAMLGFLGFLALMLVGLSPFAPRDATAVGTAAAGGAGDAVRQFAFAGVFAFVVYSALIRGGARAVSAVPTVLAVLLGWCMLSASWCVEADVALRRATLAAVVVLSAFLGVSNIGSAKALSTLRWALGLVLVANWLSIALVPQAVHLPGDPEPLLVGDWRGLYFHKNVAGSISATSAIVFFFSAWESRRPLHWALFAAAVGFAIMTQSKSSLALLPVGLAAGMFYRLVRDRPLDRLIGLVVLALVIAAIGAFLALNGGAVLTILGDPSEFTGRPEVWMAELNFIRAHPLLGAGFGSFADTGASSPLRDYLQSSWVGHVANGHNGYLEIWVTTGLVGLALASASLVAAPFVAFWRGGHFKSAGNAVWFAVFVFVVFHNCMESDFLQNDSPTWAVFLVMLASLRTQRVEASQAEFPVHAAPPFS